MPFVADDAFETREMEPELPLLSNHLERLPAYRGCALG